MVINLKNRGTTLGCHVLVLVFLSLMLCCGCATAQMLSGGESHVRVTETGKIYVGEKEVKLSALAAELKKEKIKPQTQVTVEIPHNTPANALSAIGKELASNGYRRFIFTKPRKAVADKGIDPLLKK